jgi:hypothetical protein
MLDKLADDGPVQTTFEPYQEERVIFLNDR